MSDSNDSWNNSLMNCCPGGCTQCLWRPCVASFCCCYNATTRNQYDGSNWMFNCLCVMPPVSRNVIREGYGIKGSCLSDILLSCLCGPCSAIQLREEVSHRGGSTMAGTAQSKEHRIEVQMYDQQNGQMTATHVVAPSTSHDPSATPSTGSTDGGGMTKMEKKAAAKELKKRVKKALDSDIAEDVQERLDNMVEELDINPDDIAGGALSETTGLMPDGLGDMAGGLDIGAVGDMVSGVDVGALADVAGQVDVDALANVAGQVDVDDAVSGVKGKFGGMFGGKDDEE